MATKGRTKTKATKQYCEGKRSGCMWKGQSWDTHPENPANQPGGTKMNQRTMQSHISSLKKGGYDKSNPKFYKSWTSHYQKTYGK